MESDPAPNLWVSRRNCAQQYDDTRVSQPGGTWESFSVCHARARLSVEKSLVAPLRVRPVRSSELLSTVSAGDPQKELSERLGLSFSGAKSRVQRAREKLKQQLLECCHFELDRRSHIIDYQPRCHSCETAACCSDEPLMPTVRRQTASFLQPPRLS
jgi:hypothetical protein